MNCYKQQAFEIINRLHEENRLDNSDYFAVHDGLSEIEPLRDRDEVLEELWEQFGDIPMNPETECIEAPFMGWGVGIHREEIWHWFDARHSKGIAYLLYHSGTNQTPEADKLLHLKQCCTPCETYDCCFHYSGKCRFPLVYERMPRLIEGDGCKEYVFREESADG